MTPSENAIEAICLTMKWPGVRAVDNVSIQVRRGETLCIIGPNGAGKTTLLGLLGGLLLPSAGHIRVLGLHRWKQNYEIRCRSTFLPVSPVWGLNTTAYEFLRMYAQVYGIPRKEFLARIDRLGREMVMTTHLDKKVTELSTGMQKKAGLMAAFLPDVDIRFLDEPFAGGIDPMAVERLFQWLDAARTRGETIVFSTQMLEQAETAADRILLLEHGSGVHLGTPAELMEKAGVSPTDPRPLAKAFMRLVGRDDTEPGP